MFTKKHVFLLFLLLLLTMFACQAATPKSTSDCGETRIVPVPTTTPPRQEKQYIPENSGIESKTIRTLTMGQNELWIGYADGVGIGNFDGINWRFCRKLPHVNAILLDINKDGSLKIFVGTDNGESEENGLNSYADGKWTDITTGLPDHRIYDLALSPSGNLYACTWRGCAEYNGKEWESDPDPATHTALFASNGDTWKGFISQGVLWYRKAQSKLTAVNKLDDAGGGLHKLGTNNIRKIIEGPDGSVIIVGDANEVVKDADGSVITEKDPGGIAIHHPDDSWELIAPPNDHIVTAAYDHYGRLWIATMAGVFYQEKEVWHAMPDPHSTLSIAFGCEGCVFGPDVVFFGTSGFGLIQTVVPPQQ